MKAGYPPPGCTKGGQMSTKSCEIISFLTRVNFDTFVYFGSSTADPFCLLIVSGKNEPICYEIIHFEHLKKRFCAIF